MKLKIKRIKLSRERMLILTVFGIILVVLVIFKRQNISLKNHSKYTIGVLDRLIISKAADMKFYFYFENKIYTSSGYTEDYSDKIEGSRYFVVFNDKNPKICEMLTSLKVPDSIQKAPYGGWDKIPIPEYQKYVDEYLEKSTNNWFLKLIPPW